MKTKKAFGGTLAAGAVAISLILGASVVQAAVFTDGSDSSRAVLVTDVRVGTAPEIYRVTFPADTADNIYGALPGTFTFTDFDSARAAADAVNAQLNAKGGIFYVGFANTLLNQAFNIMYQTDGSGLDATGRTAVSFTGGSDNWVTDSNFNDRDYFLQTSVYAEFEQTGVVPIPAAAWLLGSGLVALGAVARRRKMTA